MIGFINKLVQFMKDVANDERIPSRDKHILMALIVLVVSPIDIVPDWIPLFGQLDDMIIISIVLDYFFRILDSNIILSHYPWGMKSFVALKKFSQIFTFLVPNFIMRRVWKYVPPAY